MACRIALNCAKCGERLEWYQRADDALSVKQCERCREEVDGHLRWIAQQPCQRALDDATIRVCPVSGDCVTQWCLSCYARAALGLEVQSGPYTGPEQTGTYVDPDGNLVEVSDPLPVGPGLARRHTPIYCTECGRKFVRGLSNGVCVARTGRCLTCHEASPPGRPT